jgi:hypothetical protein
MFHFLQRLKSSAPQDPDASAPIGLGFAWLAIAFAAVVLPWALYPRIVGGSFHDALGLKELWSAFWPVLIGGLLSVGLGRYAHKLPRIPAGDVLVIAESAMPAARNLAAAMEGFDRRLREWPVASLLLLALTIVLVGAMFAGR